MKYIEVATGRYPLSYQQIKQENPNTSFPASLTEADGFAVVEPTDKPSFDKIAQKCHEDAPAKNEDGVWKQVWKIVDLPADQVESRRSAEYDKNAVVVRAQRNTLLSDCDWTQVADAPVDKAAWSTYRQSLRDITTQPDFPWSIVWPNKP